MMKLRKTVSLLLVLALLLALPVLAAEPEEGYEDVAEGAWYAQAAEYCAERGLMQGVGAGRFDPAGETTRAMVVTVLHRLSGSPALNREESFPDVEAGAWYAGAVDWAAVQGVTTGRGDGRFAPLEAVTRQDLAVFLWRSLGSPAAVSVEPFADEEEISAYALEAVHWARGAGIVNGMGDGSFAPKKGATRAQLASMLMKLDRSLLTGSLLEAEGAPCGLAADEAGGLLVTDIYNHCIWRLLNGESVRLAGAESETDLAGEPLGGYVDAVPDKSLFRSPWAIAPFLNGWAVADTGNNALRLVTETDVRTINAAAGEAGLPTGSYGVIYDRPMGLAADDEGRLYVADTGNGCIRVISAAGWVTTLLRDLEEPTGLCWHEGSLYIAETGKHRILRYADGELEVLAGSGEEGYLDGAAEDACFSSPMGVTVDSLGRVYVADTVNGAVRRIAEGQVVTLLKYRADSPMSWVASPVGLLAAEDSLYVCDRFSGKLVSIPIG